MIGWIRDERVASAPFLGGMTLGVVVGFVAGSALTLLLGDATLGAAKDLVDRVSGRRNRVNFELLLQ